MASYCLYGLETKDGFYIFHRLGEKVQNKPEKAKMM